jgi:uncharacterized protein
MAEVKEMIEEIARALVDAPDTVEVRETKGEHSSAYELKVASEDIGKVIGKQGRTARSIRTLLSAVGVKVNRRFSLDILE